MTPLTSQYVWGVTFTPLTSQYVWGVTCALNDTSYLSVRVGCHLCPKSNYVLNVWGMFHLWAITYVSKEDEDKYD